MKKYFSILFFFAVFFGNSGFGAIENSTYVQSEMSRNNVSNVQKVSNERVIKFVENKDISAESISEKIGEFIVGTFSLLIKSTIAFIFTLLNL